MIPGIQQDDDTNFNDVVAAATTTDEMELTLDIDQQQELPVMALMEQQHSSDIIMGDDYVDDDVTFPPPRITTESYEYTQPQPPTPNVDDPIEHEQELGLLDVSKIEEIVYVEEDEKETIDVSSGNDGDYIEYNSTNVTIPDQQNINEQPLYEPIVNEVAPIETDSIFGQSTSATTQEQESRIHPVTDTIAADRIDNVTDETEQNLLLSLSIDGDVLDEANCVHAGSDEQMSDDNFTAKQMYFCGVWGEYKLVRRRAKPNMSILYQLFHGEIVLGDDNDVSRIYNRTNYSVGNDNAVLAMKINPRIHGETMHDTVNQPSLPISSVNSAEGSTGVVVESGIPSSSSINDFVSGLDDIHKLFEGVDPPDELDVGADGASIQEVLMGSATRVVIKRISIAGRFVVRKAQQAKTFVVHHLVNALKNSTVLEKLQNRASNLAPLHWFQTTDGEFAPLRWLREDDGQSTPLRWIQSKDWGSALLQKFKNENGEMMGISTEKISNTASWVRVNAVNLYYNVESFFDKIFEGPNYEENDDVEFKFLSDMGGLAREHSVPSTDFDNEKLFDSKQEQKGER
jgi:hypothetical protein